MTHDIPQLEHMAVWAENLERTATFLSETLGWRRNPLQFGVANDNPVFGGMKLAFIDANGLWLELVQPTNDGPGMAFLEEKGNGALVELDFATGDFDGQVASLRARGIEPIGMDGQPLRGNGLLSEWALNFDKVEPADERLLYLPFGLARGTSIEYFTEYPNGALFRRDALWSPADHTPRNRPRLDHVVLLASDLEQSAAIYTDVIGLKRHSLRDGLRRDWLGMGKTAHAWIEANPAHFWIEIVAPAQTGSTPGVLSRFGDGALLQLGVEVPDIEAFHDAMAVRGIGLTGGDGVVLSAGAKAVSEQGSGDRYAYFPLDASQGMRIMVLQRGPRATSILHRRDDGWSR
jgi:catechol 2,3-dioxygenase-like lactoylglutathione lyase family enzyme